MPSVSGVYMLCFEGLNLQSKSWSFNKKRSSFNTDSPQTCGTCRDTCMGTSEGFLHSFRVLARRKNEWPVMRMLAVCRQKQSYGYFSREAVAHHPYRFLYRPLVSKMSRNIIFFTFPADKCRSRSIRVVWCFVRAMYFCPDLRIRESRGYGTDRPFPR